MRLAFILWMVVFAACAKGPSGLPQQIQVGGRSLSDPVEVGRLPIWEGPGESMDDVRVEDGRVIITSSAESQTCLAEIRADGGRVELSSYVYRGEASGAASDHHGRIAFFGRSLEDTPQGSRVDLEPQVLIVDVRAGTPPERVALALDPYRDWPLLCGGPGSITAWVKDGARFNPVVIAGAREAQKFAEPIEAPPSLCAYGGSEAALLINKGALGSVALLGKGGRSEVAIQAPVLSTMQIDTRGTLASFRSANWRGAVQLQDAGGAPHAVEIDGTIYGLTIWDRESMLVHVARGSHRAETHLALHLVSRGAGSTVVPLDEQRAKTDREPWPPPPVELGGGVAMQQFALPARGNGRPIFVRVGDALVLIDGQGRVWAWR